MSWALFLLIFFAFIGLFWVGERIDKALHKMDRPRQLGDCWDDDEWVQ